jgi:hypothetical protein
MLNHMWVRIIYRSTAFWLLVKTAGFDTDSEVGIYHYSTIDRSVNFFLYFA